MEKTEKRGKKIRGPVQNIQHLIIQAPEREKNKIYRVGIISEIIEENFPGLKDINFQLMRPQNSQQNRSKWNKPTARRITGIFAHWTCLGSLHPERMGGGHTQEDGVTSMPVGFSTATLGAGRWVKVAFRILEELIKPRFCAQALIKMGWFNRYFRRKSDSQEMYCVKLNLLFFPLALQR